MNNNDPIIESAVSECCLALFEDYALPLRRCDVSEAPGAEPLLFCGVVGFSGEQMRGTLLLATSREPLGRTSPSNDASLREWIAELANQLLGRIKNKLLSRGVTLHLSTPIVLRGEHIAPVGKVELTPCMFACEGGIVCVWFDSELAAGVDLSQEVAPPEGVVGEGTSMLF
jgi:hypothetical protein